MLRFSTLHTFVFVRFSFGASVLPLLFLALALQSCMTASKAFEQGRYNQAIQLAAAKLHKRPGDVKHTQIMASAFRMANEADFSRIRTLELSDSPTAWENIHNIYRQLESRQAMVKRALDQGSRLLPSDQFTFRDYSADLADSKNRAVEDLYVAAQELLAKANRFDARTAYDKLQRVQRLMPGYKDSENLLRMAKAAGVTRVMVTLQPTEGLSVPVAFEEEVRRIDLSALNTQWVEFTQVEIMNEPNHYYMEVRFDQFVVSPEQIRERNYEEKARIEDGWEYKKNADGSIARDTSGNRIKVTVFREVKVRVRLYQQIKTASALGSIQMADGSSGQILAQRRFSGVAEFLNEWGTARGDSRALSKQSRRAINGRRLAFPADAALLQQAAPQFRAQMFSQLQALRSLAK